MARKRPNPTDTPETSPTSSDNEVADAEVSQPTEPRPKKKSRVDILQADGKSDAEILGW
jgi:hypothetical protein